MFLNASYDDDLELTFNILLLSFVWGVPRANFMLCLPATRQRHDSFRGRVLVKNRAE